jgi:signal transduction histidine kinase
MVSVDGARLQQAVNNLIASAVSTAREGSTVGVWVRDEPGGEVAIGIRYEGNGNDVSRMFDPFDGGAKPGEPRGWALGLGRAISRGIAEACGGRVEASHDGVTTSVVMRLPSAA